MAEKTPEEIAAEAAAEKAAKEAAEKAAADAKVPKFNPEQTDAVNAIFSNAFRTGAEKAEKEAKAKIDALAAEKAALEAKAAELEAKLKGDKKETPPPANTPNPELEMIKNQMLEMKGIFDQVKSERDKLRDQVEAAAKERVKTKKKDLFLGALKDAKVNFFDPLEAYKLAEDDGYEYDAENDKPLIKNKATGVAKLNENGEPMSVTDFVKDFAKRKNYLVQSGEAGGTGSSENRQTKPKEESKPLDFSTMSNEDFEKYRQEVLIKANKR